MFSDGKLGKSGKGTKNLTKLQKFKVESYMFVREVYRPRTQHRGLLGQVKIAAIN